MTKTRNVMDTEICKYIEATPGMKVTMLKKLEATQIPGRMHDSLVRWVTEGRVSGHFLTAVLTNDLKEAVARADDENANALRDYVLFLYNNVPAGCFGSPERVTRWADMWEAYREEKLAKTETKEG